MPIILEEAALQSVGSGIPVDGWPCYTLKDVSVLSESTKELVSLFSGHKNHAIRVVGYLQEIPEPHAHLVLDPTCTHASTRLIVKNVTSWSCERSSADRSWEFYAVGKAGKYLIQTSATLYETVFAQMNETASMFNFIETKLRNMRKKAADLSDAYVNNYGRFTFNEYLNSPSNCLQRQSVEDVRAGFHEYAEYIITMMLLANKVGESERIDWESSPMMRYFKQKCPEQNAKVRSRVNPTGPAKLSFRPNFQRQEEHTTSTTTIRKRAKRSIPEEADDDDDFDTTDQTFPLKNYDNTKGPDDVVVVRGSTRVSRAAPGRRRAKTSSVPMHGLSQSQDFEHPDDAAESKDEEEEEFVRNPRDSRPTDPRPRGSRQPLTFGNRTRRRLVSEEQLPLEERRRREQELSSQQQPSSSFRRNTNAPSLKNIRPTSLSSAVDFASSSGLLRDGDDNISTK